MSEQRANETDPPQGVEIVPADPRIDPELLGLVDRAFERTGAESLLLERLAAEHPEFDGELSMMALLDGVPVGWALFMPRTLRLFEQWVRVVVSSPFAVLPEARRKGVATCLLEQGLQRARERGAVGAVVLGGREFFGRHGYAPAFRMHTLRVRASDLPPADESGWRGLTPPDIEGLAPLYEACYGHEDGAERRLPIVIEWESQVPHGHARVLADEHGPLAAVRFRVDGTVEVREATIREPRAIEPILAYLHHLAEIHSLDAIEVSCPPSHPVARALFHRGALALSSDLERSALLRVLDWPALLEATEETWRRRLRGVPRNAVSLGLPGSDLRLGLGGERLSVESGREPGGHVHLPAEQAASLLTGHRGWRDILEDREALERCDLDTAGLEALRAMFPHAAPDWSYGPMFELADR